MPDNESKLVKINKDVSTKLDKLTKSHRGYGLFVQNNIINPDIEDLKVENYGINNVASIQDTLFNLRGKDKFSKYKVNDIIYADLYANREDNRKVLESMMNNRLLLNLEYNYILNNMPEMVEVLDQLAIDTVFPISMLKSGISLKFNHNDEGKPGERDEDLEKYFRPLLDPSTSIRNKRLYNFDIETVVHDLVIDVATYGYQIACTIPYKNIVTDLLYEAKNNVETNQKTASGESYNPYFESYNNEYFVNEKNINAFAEGLYDTFERVRNNTKKLPFSEFRSSIIPNIKDHIESLNNLFYNSPYSESDVDYIINYIKNDNINIFNEIDRPNLVGNNINSLSDLAISESANEYSKVLEEMYEKRNKKFILDNIKGCTFEFLDINKVQPIFIKDELIGAYVIDYLPDYNKTKLGSTLSNMINSSTLDDGIHLQDNYKKALKKVVFRDVENVLRNNISKTFLRNNPNLIEDIEWILQKDDIMGIDKARIRFIPSEYLTLFKIGKGPLGESLLAKSKTYAMAHIQLMKSELVNKVFGSKPRYLIKVHDTGNLSSQTTITEAIMSARNAIPRLTDIGIPDIATDSLLANYQTVLMHTNPNNEESISIDQIPLIEPQDNSDFLRQLRNHATQPLGYPSDLLDPSQNIDFAKKITAINERVLSKVLAMQKAITLSLSELCTKRLKYMTGDSNLEVIVEFTPPKEMDDNVTIEALDKLARKIEMYELMIDNNIEIKDNEKPIVKYKLGKKLFSDFLDLDLMKKTLDETIIEGVGDDE